MTAISTSTAITDSSVGLSGCRLFSRLGPEHSSRSEPSAKEAGKNPGLSIASLGRLAAKKALSSDGETVEMTGTTIVEASIDKIDLAQWFHGPVEPHGRSTPALASGSMAAPDGKPMSVQVELIGGSLIMQYYVETNARKDNLVLESHSDLFTSQGPTSIHIRWEVSVTALEGGRSKLTNRVQSRTSQAFMAFLDRQGIEIEAFRSQCLPTPELRALAKSISRAAARS
ncbi:hypothetical protein FJ934_08260 [Mesorhizobium sp. B2-4-12]|uniref:hypothetical protein n=1 Tax=unclassified Mesorhizobium TaxID=325217 RepID=UPI0011279160|nr:MULTISPECIES: hypothetical protein [unclassified Mesorhizobium]TPK96935.1 hypothetical protein FJ934_08260 [Mesorhizobium sp. B2-4-12]TPL11500.1 hypothetical protein FJ938_01855 [Mesorhizobium sp. B2-4-14]